MTGPTIRASVESGATYNDPSEEQLVKLVTDVHTMAEEFLVVERTADSTGQTYIQCAEVQDGDGRWQFAVEYREGGPDRHYQAFIEASHDDPMRIAAIVIGWVVGRPNWRDGLNWRRLTFD
jgi:hypothetical protein